MRELVWMSEGRGRAEWGRTASLLAMLANVNRDPKKQAKPFTPNDFLPDEWKAKTEKKPLTKANLSILRDVFVAKKERMR